MTPDRRKEFEGCLWQQGRLLLTKVTRNWNQSTWEFADNDEKHYAFVNFTSQDEGRSRVCIYRFDSPQECEKAVQEHNLALRIVK